jgi:hypothetical protein
MAGPHQNEPEGVLPTTETAVRYLHVRKQRPDKTVGQTCFLRFESSRVLQAHRRERTFLEVRQPMDNGRGLLGVAGEEEIGATHRKNDGRADWASVHQYTQQGSSSSKLILKNPEQNEILGYILRRLISRQ